MKRSGEGEFFDALREMIREIVREEVAGALADTTKPSQYLSTEEAASLARVAAGTIRRWIRGGKLDAVRAGREIRVRRADLEGAMCGEHGSEPDIEAMAEAAVQRRLAR